MIPEFGGASEQNAETWFKRVETVKTTYNLTDEVTVLIVVSKLRKKNAITCHNSKSEYAALTHAELQAHMISMFSRKKNKIVLMRKFDSSKWRKNETFANYYHKKLLLGNQLDLPEDLISYMIDEFDNPTLQSQARMSRFSSLQELLSEKNTLSSTECHQTTYSRPNRTNVNESTKNLEQKMVSDKKLVTCFYWSKVGHFASDCPLPKKVVCFRCQEVGHRKKDCPKGTRDPRRDFQVADSTTMVLMEQSPIPKAYNLLVELQDGMSRIQAL